MTPPEHLPTDESFRLLVDAVNDYAIFMLDPSGRVVTWNAGAQKMKGYEAEEIIGQHIAVFHTPADLAASEPDATLTFATARVEPKTRAGGAARMARRSGPMSSLPRSAMNQVRCAVSPR